MIIFKKKRRKGYKKKNGFRASLTEIKIESIVASGAKAAAKKAEPKAEKEAAPKAEKAAAPKAEAKKEAAPKAEAKADASNDLSSKTVAELKEMAKAKEISGYSSMKKAELIEALSK